MRRSSVMLWGIVSGCSLASAEELHVPGEYPTIQAAIDVTFHGDCTAVQSEASMEPISSVASGGSAGSIDRHVESSKRAHESNVEHVARFVSLERDPESDNPSDVVFTPDGSRFIIAHRESQNLAVWDAIQTEFICSIDVSGAVQSIAVSPDGETIAAVNLDNNTVSIVDLVAMNETHIIPVGLNPGVVRVSPAGDVAAVAITGDSQLCVVDLASAQVIRTIEDVGFYLDRGLINRRAPAASIRFGPIEFIDDDRVVTLDSAADEFQIINVRTGDVHRIALSEGSRTFAVSDDRTVAAVTHPDPERRISVIDLVSGTLVHAFSTGTHNLWGGAAIAVNHDGTRALVEGSPSVRGYDLVAGEDLSNWAPIGVVSMIPLPDGFRVMVFGTKSGVYSFTGPLLLDGTHAGYLGFGAINPVTGEVVGCASAYGDHLALFDPSAPVDPLVETRLTGPPVESDRCRSVDITADGATAIAVSYFSDNLFVIDTESGLASTAYQTGREPVDAAITPDGSLAVVANYASDFVTVIDLATGQTTEIQTNIGASNVEISPDGDWAYVAHSSVEDGVWRINLQSKQIHGDVLYTSGMSFTEFSYAPYHPAVLSPDGSLLAVVAHRRLSLIDTAGWLIVGARQYSSQDPIEWVSFGADSRRVFISTESSGRVDVYDWTGSGFEFALQIMEVDTPWQVIERDNGFVYVNSWGDSAIKVYPPGFGGFPVSTIQLSSPCVSMAIDEDRNLLYVASGDSVTEIGGAVGYEHEDHGRVHVIDLVSHETVESIQLGHAPSDFAFDQAMRIAVLAAPEADGAFLVSPVEGCNPADLVPPFGALDFDDVLAFLSAFAAMDPLADLAPAFGEFDFDDILVFLAAFGAGCP